MYVPAAFAETDLARPHALIEQHSFGLLVSTPEGQPFASHLPFLLDRFTVADLTRSIDFFTSLLDFALVDRFEVNDREYDALQGVFGANTVIAHLQLASK